MLVLAAYLSKYRGHCLQPCCCQCCSHPFECNTDVVSEAWDLTWGLVQKARLFLLAFQHEEERQKIPRELLFSSIHICNNQARKKASPNLPQGNRWVQTRKSGGSPNPRLPCPSSKPLPVSTVPRRTYLVFPWDAWVHVPMP